MRRCRSVELAEPTEASRRWCAGTGLRAAAAEASPGGLQVAITDPIRFKEANT